MNRIALCCTVAVGLSVAACTRGTAQTLERRTGLAFCSAPGSNNLKTFDRSLLYVEQPGKTCWEWHDAIPGVAMRTARSDHNGIALPVTVTYRSEKVVSGVRSRIFLRIVGGPGGSVAPQQLDSLYANLLHPGDLMVTPAYEGTRHGTLYPQENFSAATSRIAFWLKELRNRNPDAEIVLAGESLGANIALGALPLVGAAKPDQVILLSPLAYSPIEARANFTAMRGAEYRNDRSLSVRVFAPAAPGYDDGHWRNVLSTDLFKTFFPAEQDHATLADRLSAVGAGRVLVIYGGKDRIVGVDRLASLRHGPTLEIQRIDAMDHVVDTVSSSQVSDRMRRFLSGKTTKSK